MKKKITIVDDHVLIANALGEIISNFKNFEILSICESGQVLMSSFEKGNIPDVVLLDVSMPIMDGFETAKWLKENHPDVLVMALSMQDDESSLIKMIKNGAKGYMLKNIKPDQLEKGLNILINKGRFFPEWASDKIFNSLLDDDKDAPNSIFLSDREIEFLKYTVSEMSYKKIAEKMYCSPRTIENYRDSLFQKLNLKSRVGLAIYAMKNGYGTE
ncbi:response regulator transcription factor [Aquimarina algiphila]|uniref:Response regulator transcription factor n=1 Tax=Aquimarina algiphila TaxID=2047982 RepID=A0A554VJB2_9FLAO|nr:response regulator transcription factor [Aquimarina algiphila]TSE07992.1 response regulator transcription factor [Aquimarina algiphila]